MATMLTTWTMPIRRSSRKMQRVKSSALEASQISQDNGLMPQAHRSTDR